MSSKAWLWFQCSLSCCAHLRDFIEVKVSANRFNHLEMLLGLEATPFKSKKARRFQCTASYFRFCQFAQIKVNAARLEYLTELLEKEAGLVWAWQ
ncbi:unnamed protein product [Symbiodinium sp. CCMP2592]|nr:unnamed protein product [Symbiodinium sp. CCMP2592]